MTKRAPDGHGWLFPRQAALYANCSIDVIRRAVNSGDLPAYQSQTVSATGKRRARICVDDIDDFMRSTPRAFFGPMCD